MAKYYMLRKEIEVLIKIRNWSLNTRIDYKEKFSGSDQLKIICSCGRPQTLGVKSLKKFICPFCNNKYKNSLFHSKKNINIKNNYKRNEKKPLEYKKWEGKIPPYILNAMLKYPTKELLTLSGNKSNPTIHYICKSCGREQMCKFRNLKKGHNCIANKSSGKYW